MYGIQDKINQILRGAETIKKNSMTTNTPRTDAERNKAFCNLRTDYEAYAYMANHAKTLESELTASQAEVDRLTDALARVTDFLAISNRLWREEDEILQRWKDFGITKKQ